MRGETIADLAVGRERKESIMKNVILLVLCTMVMTIASGAKAQSLEACEFGEQIDWYVDESGVEHDIYRDEFTGDMWEQPAEMDPVKAMTLDLTIPLITPEWLRIRKNGTATYYYESSGQIVYSGTCGTRCYLWYARDTGYPQNVDDIKARGVSGDSDLCDGEYEGYYWDVGDPYTSQYDSCGLDSGEYWYQLSEYEDLSNYDYSSTYPRAVSFEYESTFALIYETQIRWQEVPE